MEGLYAEFLLWDSGFTTGESYGQLLDDLFLQDDGEALLLELEMCSSDPMQTWHHFTDYWLRHPLDTAVFERKLILAMRRIYDAQIFTDAAFSSHCYRLWLALPKECADKMPFLMLCDIDEYPYAFDDKLQKKRLAEFLTFVVDEEGDLAECDMAKNV